MPNDGPVPKRSTERRRRNKVEVDSVPAVVGSVEVPTANEFWHPLAVRWFESLKVSGQSRFYEASDWAAAEITAEAITRTFTAPPFSAISFSAMWGAMSELLTTEGARRRARMEIEREVEKAPPAGVTAIAAFRKRAQ
jgi:hypothetical protein